MTQNRPRRLAAVWVADIVGYDDLSARDEDLAMRAVWELQRIAKKHCQARGGRLVKLMGDAVLTEFDGAEGAVRAAVGLRDEFLASEEAKAGEVSLQVGVHVGEVADGPDGDIYGEAVNVASRLQSVAGKGQILITEDNYKLIRESFKCEKVGEVTLKNKVSPVTVYEVIS